MSDTTTKHEAHPPGASVPPEAPLTTKTIVLTGFGGYDKLKIQQRPRPTSPGEGEILLHVRASGINFAELSIRQGVYDRLPETPAVLGLEASGDVLGVGKNVTGFKAGDRVFCVKNLGLWAEHVLVPANQCFHMPAGMSYEEGAALPVNYVTAYHILFNFGNLRKGQSVLVHMAAGGVGMAATQLCRTVPDVIVYGTASLGKHDVIQQNGVDHPINYRSADYVEEIRKIDPEGVDIVMDPLSGTDSVKGFDLLKPLGKIIHFGVANAVNGPSKSYWSMVKSYMGVKSYNSMEMITKNRAICGYHLGHLVDKPQLIKSAIERLLELYQEGKIKPHIDSVWAFEDIGLAMAKIHDRANIGKVIISPQKERQEHSK
jgi:NADPH:quinone reductase-like Zn-dependent oxidoreductase